MGCLHRVERTRLFEESTSNQETSINLILTISTFLVCIETLPKARLPIGRNKLAVQQARECDRFYCKAHDQLRCRRYGYDNLPLEYVLMYKSWSPVVRGSHLSDTASLQRELGIAGRWFQSHWYHPETVPWASIMWPFNERHHRLIRLSSLRLLAEFGWFFHSVDNWVSFGTLCALGGHGSFGGMLYISIFNA